jgi:hypothetical protein
LAVGFASPFLRTDFAAFAADPTVAAIFFTAAPDAAFPFAALSAACPPRSRRPQRRPPPQAARAAIPLRRLRRPRRPNPDSTSYRRPSPPFSLSLPCPSPLLEFPHQAVRRTDAAARRRSFPRTLPVGSNYSTQLQLPRRTGLAPL